MILGLNGNKGVGKDEIASYLVENHDFDRWAFADIMKDAAASLWGIPREWVDLAKNDDTCSVEFKHTYSSEAYTYSWREFLQRFGTEMGRNTFGEDFWVDLLLPPDEKINGNIVITDARFENEAKRILSLGGFIIEVTRPGHVPDGHASENKLDHDLIDAWIDNNGTLEELYRDVDQLVEDIYVGRIPDDR